MPAYTSARELFSQKEPGCYTMQGYLSQFEEVVKGHEGQSILIAVATGFCVGALIGSALVGSQPERMSDRLAAEGIGRRFLSNLEQYLPQSLSEKLHR